MDNDKINDIIVSERFTDLINEAAPLKVKIQVDLANDMKENCNDFIKEIAKSDPNINKILNKKNKNRDDSEKEILRTWMKNQKKKFKSITKMLAPKSNSDPLKSIVEKLTEIIQYARYIGNTELEDRLRNFGITLNAQNLEDENPYFANNDVKEIIKDIFAQSKEIQENINNTNEEIKDRIYSELDDSIKFSTDNPSGIKSSQFSKLVNSRAVSMIKSEDQYSKFKEKLIEKDTNDIKSRELVLEKTKTL